MPFDGFLRMLRISELSAILLANRWLAVNSDNFTAFRDFDGRRWTFMEMRWCFNCFARILFGLMAVGLVSFCIFSAVFIAVDCFSWPFDGFSMAFREFSAVSMAVDCF